MMYILDQYKRNPKTEKKKGKKILYLTHLDVLAAGDLSELLLLFQCLVYPVVRHAEHPHSGLDGVVRLGKDDKFGHKRYRLDLQVEVPREIARLVDLFAVH